MPVDEQAERLRRKWNVNWGWVVGPPLLLILMAHGHGWRMGTASFMEWFVYFDLTNLLLITVLPVSLFNLVWRIRHLTKDRRLIRSFLAILVLAGLIVERRIAEDVLGQFIAVLASEIKQQCERNHECPKDFSDINLDNTFEIKTEQQAKRSVRDIVGRSPILQIPLTMRVDYWVGDGGQNFRIRYFTEAGDPVTWVGGRSATRAGNWWEITESK